MGDGAFVELLDIMTRMSDSNRLEDGTRLACRVQSYPKRPHPAKTLEHLIEDPTLKAKVFDPRCGECRKGMKELCPVVCNNCRRIHIWMDPGPKGFGYAIALRKSFFTRCNLSSTLPR